MPISEDRRHGQRRTVCETCPLTDAGTCHAHELVLEQNAHRVDNLEREVTTMRKLSLWGLGAAGASLMLLVPILASGLVYLSKLAASTEVLAVRASNNASAISEIRSDVRDLRQRLEPEPVP